MPTHTKRKMITSDLSAVRRDYTTGAVTSDVHLRKCDTNRCQFINPLFFPNFGIFSLRIVFLLITKIISSLKKQIFTSSKRVMQYGNALSDKNRVNFSIFLFWRSPFTSPPELITFILLRAF